MNGHFIGFQQLVQKLERITPIISTLQNKQNEWSLYGISSTRSRVKTIITIISTFRYKQNECSLYRVSSTGSKIRMSGINLFSSR